MAKKHLVYLLVLVLYVKAAPSTIDEQEPTQIDSSQTVETPEISLLQDDKVNATQGRQKRWYNYGPPPPPFYPDFPRNSQNFDQDDPMIHIQRRLQSIADYVRQPALPPVPPPPRFPVFYPVFYLPPTGCNCLPSLNTPQPTQPQPTPRPNGTTSNGTTPNLEDRITEMDDTRRNWGLVVNETEDALITDNAPRPISFEPIPPKYPLTRPPPPVEHGSVQSDANAAVQAAYIPPESTTATNPTACDAAIITCCHQPTVTYNCFSSQGCTDPGALGNPCNPKLALAAIAKFQKIYGLK